MKARIHITLKNGVLDPQAKAIQTTLHTMGFTGVDGVRQGKFIELELGKISRDDAAKSVDAMCQKLLANMVMENYRYELEE